MAIFDGLAFAAVTLCIIMSILLRSINWLIEIAEVKENLFNKNENIPMKWQINQRN